VRVLAIDTATERGSVALVRDGVVVGEELFSLQEGYSTFVLPAVALLLEKEGIPPGSIDGFGVTLGPGSFTGLRVGISSIQGLALASGRPAIGISTLDVLAMKIRGKARTLVTAVDAYREQVFVGLYDADARREGELRLLGRDEFIRFIPEGAALLGDGVLRYAEAIRAARTGLLFSDESLFLASTLARCVETRLAAGERGGPLAPIYLREAAIRRPM
jgi:tRNA threonylcarbamoyladenosine biosynthesis protein TsaB